MTKFSRPRSAADLFSARHQKAKHECCFKISGLNHLGKIKGNGQGRPVYDGSDTVWYRIDAPITDNEPVSQEPPSPSSLWIRWESDRGAVECRTATEVWSSKNTITMCTTQYRRGHQIYVMTPILSGGIPPHCTHIEEVDTEYFFDTDTKTTQILWPASSVGDG